MSERTPEDLVEQQSTPTRDAALGELPDVPLEADDADAAEQAVVVELDEDERRSD
ncbi:MAG: hypothetical protein WD794_09855 [Mycobacteriales bacterium]